MCFHLLALVVASRDPTDTVRAMKLCARIWIPAAWHVALAAPWLRKCLIIGYACYTGGTGRRRCLACSDAGTAAGAAIGSRSEAGLPASPDAVPAPTAGQ